MTTAVKGTKILVKLQDPNNIGAGFQHPCMINLTRSISFEASMNEDEVFDCDNPDNPATVFAFKKSNKFTVEGTGKLDAASLAFWLAFQASPNSYAAEIVWNVPGASGGQTVTCNLACSKFESSGEPAMYATGSVSLQSDGAWTIAPNA